MEKIGMKEKAALRNQLYAEIEEAFAGAYEFEPSCDGMLVALENGLYAEVTVTVKNEEKFDIDVARKAYAEKMARAAERAAKSLEVAERKAQKAAEKAAKAQATEA